VTLDETEVGGAGFGRFNTAMTLVVCAATVAIPYWVDRAVRRWWEANRLIAPVGTRFRGMLTRSRSTGFTGRGSGDSRDYRRSHRRIDVNVPPAARSSAGAHAIASSD
jgi:hypothetical protein